MNLKRIQQLGIIATAIWVAIWIWQFKFPCLVALSIFDWWDDRFCGTLLVDDAEHLDAVILATTGVGIGVPIILWLLGSAIRLAFRRD